MNLLKQILLTASFATISLLGYCQDDSLHTVNKKIAEAHCNSGKGNGTFKITIPQLEKIILGKYNQAAFLKLLPKYYCQYELAFTWNEKTKNFDVPEFTFNYAYVDGNFNPTGISLKIVMEGNIQNRIESLEIEGISASAYDNLLNILNKTYLYRGSISNSHDKHFVNHTKKLVVILHKSPSGLYSISIV